MRLVFDSRNKYNKAYFAIRCECGYTMFFVKGKCENCRRVIPDDLIEARENANIMICAEYNIDYKQLWR